MSRKIVNRVADVNCIPTLPAIAMEAIRLMEGEDSNFASIADLLKNDQVLAGRLLHYANSASIGSRRKVSSISQAISVLGLNATRSIILSAAIFDYFSEELAHRKQSLLNFWLHSIGVAVTAEILAQKLAFPVPEEAYIAGLIHDLGKLVCYSQDPTAFEEIWQELEQYGSYSTQGPLPLELERNILGIDHIEMGKVIADKWGLPEALARVMWLHHQPVYETILPEENNIPQLIRFADVLCVTHNIGSSYLLPEGTYCHEHFHFALENLVLHHHLTPVDIETIMDRVYQRVKEVGNTLGFWDEQAYQRLIRSANVSLGSLSMNLERRNRELTENNRVLDATCEMTRRIKAGTSLFEAAAIIVETACRVFEVNRSLCLIRDDREHAFTGQLREDDENRELAIPFQQTLPRRTPDRKQTAAIEQEAVHLLSRANLDLSQGAQLESGLVDIVAGSRFLATFFVADKGSSLEQGPVLGELLVDFGEDLPPAGDTLDRLLRSFEALALAANSAIERLLLEIDLSRQAEEMAEANRKMEESQRQLFHSHRLATVGRLAAGAAHEINNPLTIISLNIQIMERLLQQDNFQALPERLTVIGEQEERISKIIQDLMSFARPTQPKFVPASVPDIVNQVLSVLGDRVSMNKIEVENSLTADLPQVMVDPLQIEQVFMNLFINANHAMPEGGTLGISARPKGHLLEISVADTGEGIDPKHLTKIFDPFFTTKKEGEGTGLGLAICHSIVEHNGGTLRVQSKKGEGTTFTLSLPLDKSSRMRALRKQLERDQPPARHTGPRQSRILVVDDERILNDMLQDSLRAAGYQADGAYDGLQALEMLEKKTYELLILDIRMPNKDGLEVLEFVRSTYPRLQVLIITALASKEEIKETLRLGAFACLRKPFRLEKVLETVGEALQGATPP